MLHASRAINEETSEDYKNKTTYHGLLVNFASNNVRTLEHVLSGTGGEAHFLLSGTRVLVGAILPGEFAPRSTCVWRNVAEIGRGEGCHELALMSKKYQRLHDEFLNVRVETN